MGSLRITSSLGLILIMLRTFVSGVGKFPCFVIVEMYVEGGLDVPRRRELIRLQGRQSPIVQGIRKIINSGGLDLCSSCKA
jgi:hypothetical protein